MAHLSEDSKPLRINYIEPTSRATLYEKTRGFNDVCLLRLPARNSGINYKLEDIESLVEQVATNLGKQATLITIGESLDLAHVHTAIASKVQYQLWIVIKTTTPLADDKNQSLPKNHFGALVHTSYRGSLNHTKTRIEYTYCPACDKTTKDYGGKKHTYHNYGTLMSDVWRDITSDLDGDLGLVYERFADLFGLESYQELLVCDCRPLISQTTLSDAPAIATATQSKQNTQSLESGLVLGDCLEQLKQLPDNSIDFAFADPPYNLGKKYTGYDDDLAIAQYFEWCDKWITELARVLKPGRTLAVLNIPLWSIRHFAHMETILQFQNWIAWDALSFPVRQIMPAHYTILCFSKGVPRSLPGLTGPAEEFYTPSARGHFMPLEPLDERFCLRSNCIRERTLLGVNDRGTLTDLWGDIHRLKHNSRRVDHPCQLPPELMYRLISVFTQHGEMVLDCFNGAGTTTLTAHQLDRRYMGIEAAEKYHKIAEERHNEIEKRLDPFRKDDRVLTSKNSPVPRMPKQIYEVPKKTLQLEVKRIAKMLGRLPTRDEVIEHANYPIKYYDDYFASWGEVCAAARTTGMSETRKSTDTTEEQPTQLSLLSYRTKIEQLEDR